MNKEIVNLESGINLRQYLASSQHDQLILHGTMDTPDLDIRPDYPKTWEEKIKYAVKTRPHIAAKQIYTASSEFDCWYPVGLVVNDGTITSCSDDLSDTLDNGDRVSIRGKSEEPNLSLIERLESAKFYEVAVREPCFSALYLCYNPLHLQVVPRLSVGNVKRLAQNLGLPAIIFKNIEELFLQARGLIN